MKKQGEKGGKKSRRGIKRLQGTRMNSAAAAEFLGITERTLRWLRSTRQICYHKFGRECVYDMAELARAWEDSRVEAVR